MDNDRTEMFKGSKSRGFSGGGNGGVGGTGVHGFLGTTILCSSTDNSFYCSFMKLIQVGVWIFIICAILYYAYSFFRKRK